jgi:hypothetical protein
MSGSQNSIPTSKRTTSNITDGVIVRGKCILSFTGTSASSANIIIDSLISSRLATLSALFVNYRFRRLRLVLPPQNMTSTVAYYPEEKASSVSNTFIPNGESSSSVLFTSAQTTSTVLDVPTSVLNSGTSQKWYSTGTTDDPDPFAQGSFNLRLPNSTTFTIFGMLLYEIEFRGSKPSNDL